MNPPDETERREGAEAPHSPTGRCARCPLGNKVLAEALAIGRRDVNLTLARERAGAIRSFIPKTLWTLFTTVAFGLRTLG